MASQSTTSVSISSAPSSFVTPSPSQSPSSSRLVRFQEHCVLIPESSVLIAAKSPRIMTKSLSLPVINLQLPWKRSQPVALPTQSSIPEQEELQSSPETSSPYDHRVVKVPVPIFRRKSLSPTRDAESRALPPCLVHRYEPMLPSLSASLSLPTFPSSPPKAGVSAARGRPVRAASLPTPLRIETVPLRPCCAKCFAACESLPPLVGSSREDADPPTNHIHSSGDSADDWCAGMRFTKGALRRRRSASTEGEGFRTTALRVDEVDRRHRTPKPKACISPNLAHLKTECCDRRTSDTGSDDSVNADDSELFPLPSPKRTPTGSPYASPSTSTQNLPGLFLHEPGKLETAIRQKIAQRAREKEAAALLASNSGKFFSGTATSPVAIPGSSSKDSRGRSPVSHFHSHTDKIEYDKSLPDPDALPPDSTILLNSPPYPSLAPASQKAPPNMAAMSPSPSPPKKPDAHVPSERRRLSLSAGVVSVVHAGVGILRGINMSTSSSIAV